MESLKRIKRSSTKQKKKLDLSKIDPQILDDLREVFDLFDIDGNQSITYHEINRAFIALDDKQSIKKIRKMIKKVDKNKDGELNFEEFVELMHQNLEKYRKISDESEYKAVFGLLDKNGDGEISADELYRVMNSIGISLSYEEVNLAIKETDKDCNGTINYKEFRNMLIHGPKNV
ncbi:hypothetical protein MHBO_002384 [Bonamia ostreae]|uniref:EF-hand domain-containing protein n=1 Tax=Bonamia ostreae TaxID=126728 RepID=A0ABV2AMR0_9EUKA